MRIKPLIAARAGVKTANLTDTCSHELLPGDQRNVHHPVIAIPASLPAVIAGEISSHNFIYLIATGANSRSQPRTGI